MRVTPQEFDAMIAKEIASNIKLMKAAVTNSFGFQPEGLGKGRSLRFLTAAGR
jgi:hypothetical protein